MKENQILVIIKEPGKAPVVEPLFDNDLKAFQEAVGGHIETVTLATDLVIICNEEGRLMGLPYNVTLFGVPFVGTIVITGAKGEEFASLRSSAIPMLMQALNEKGE